MAPLTVALAAFLMVIPRFLCNAQVDQDPLVIASEGGQANLTCRHSSMTSDTIFWYRQFPNQTFHNILSGYNSGSSSSTPEGILFVASGRKGNVFSITRASLLDSAVYYCALGNTYRVTFGSGTRLVVLPDIEDSEPSVYKLKPRKGDNENLSACLITDYSPGNILAGLNGSLESISSSFVITSYGASYGTIVWDDKPGNFSCSASHKGKTYSDLTEDADGPPVEEFETDERLNFISITVLGLRVIFLKSVAINLLLTFRLWSC